MGFSTAGTIVNNAAVELGLVAFNSKPSDPFASSDPNIGLLCQLMSSAGKMMNLEYGWSQFQTEYTFSSIAGQTEYSLPSDFLSMINQTGWDRTNRLPLGGPLDAQEWQYLQGRLVNVVFFVLFRPRVGKLKFDLNPSSVPGGHTIAFEYKSSYFVQPNGQSSPTTDTPSASSDTIWFDSLLMMRALKYEWRKNKGFDVTAAKDDFERALRALQTADTPAPALKLDGRSYDEPLIGAQNIPLTGIGN